MVERGQGLTEHHTKQIIGPSGAGPGQQESKQRRCVEVAVLPALFQILQLYDTSPPVHENEVVDG